MSLTKILAAVVVFTSSTAAVAEPISIATARQGSSTHNLGLAVSTVAAEISDLDIRPLPFQSTSQALPMVDSNEIGLGLENAYALLEATSGAGTFENFQQKNLRLVARLLPLRMTVGVRAGGKAGPPRHAAGWGAWVPQLVSRIGRRNRR